MGDTEPRSKRLSGGREVVVGALLDERIVFGMIYDCIGDGVRRIMGVCQKLRRRTDRLLEDILSVMSGAWMIDRASL